MSKDEPDAVTSALRHHCFPPALVLLCTLFMSACSADAPRTPFDSLDFVLADAGSGEKLFNQSNSEAPACAACHTITGKQRHRQYAGGHCQCRW